MQEGSASAGISFAFSGDSSKVLDSNTPNNNDKMQCAEAEKDADNINGMVVVSDIKPQTGAGIFLVDDAEKVVNQTPVEQASFLSVHPGAAHDDGLSHCLICLSVILNLFLLWATTFQPH